MRPYVSWSAGLLLAVVVLTAQLATGPTAIAPAGGRGGGPMLAQQGQPAPVTPAVVGVDGPIPQAPDGTPAVPFIMAPPELRRMADIIAEQQARDVARVGPPVRPLKPEFHRPERRQIPQNPASPEIARWPPAAPDLRESTPHVLTVGTTVEGPTLNDTGALPPDTMGDVGPTQYFVAYNGQMRVYSKATGAPEAGLSFDPDVFFSSVTNGSSTTDPRIRYDRLSGRWFVVYITIAVPNRIVLAVSNSSIVSPSTVWSFSFLTNTVVNGTSEPCLGDYETLGIDNSALYVGVNQFCGTDIPTVRFFTTSGFVINKASLLAGAPTVALFSPLTAGPSGAGPFTPQGADNIDPASTAGYFIGVDNMTFGQLDIIRITNPAGVPAAQVLPPITVPTTRFPLHAPHLNGTKLLDALDDRLMNAVVRNGRLYTAHAIGTDSTGVASTDAARTRAAVRWYEIENLSTTPALRQTGTIFDGAVSNPLYYWLPSINVNSPGDIVVGYSSSSAAVFAGAATSHRRAADPLGTMQASTPLITGAAAYNPAFDPGADYRWGDYSMVSVDPDDDVAFWTAQMYGRFSNVYGTRAVKLIVNDVPLSAPTSINDSYATLIGTALTVLATGVLSNDESTGGPMQAFLVSTTANGVLSLNANGGFTYTPNPGFSGTDTFTYRAANIVGPGNVATVSIAVSATPPPVANTDTYTTAFQTALVVPAATGVLANDIVNGGGAMTAVLVANPTHGTLALASDGSFTYTPAAGFVGADVFRYRASTSFGLGNVATVTLTVVVPTTAQPPTGLFAANVTGNTVTLRWTPPAVGPAPTGYVLEGGIGEGSVLASFPTGSADPIFTFEAPTGSFHVRIHTLSGSSRSPASNEIVIHPGQLGLAPSAPGTLLSLVNGSTVALSWVNTFGGGAPTALALDVAGTAVTSIPLGLTNAFSFAGVPDGTYTLRLRATNGGGSSLATTPVTLSFPGACSGAPQVPSQFLARKTGNLITVLWDQPTSGPAPTSYVLNVSGAFTGALPTTARGLAGTVGNGSYTLSVVAVNACGTGPATTPVTVTIP